LACLPGSLFCDLLQNGAPKNKLTSSRPNSKIVSGQKGKEINRREHRVRRERIRYNKKMDSCFRRNDDIKNLSGLCKLGGKRKTKRY